MTCFAVVDLELTSRDIEAAHVVEWAAVIMEPEWFGEGGIRDICTRLVRPPVSIPAETSAVHHIVDADVAQAPPWEASQVDLRWLLTRDPDTIVVGHSVDTERRMLEPLGLTCRWLCTYKAALRVWPDAPAHSNEGLRYWLAAQYPAGAWRVGRAHSQAPHSAKHDALVTVALLETLMRVGTDPAEMIKWTDEPAMIPRCPMGAYRGRKWDEIEDITFIQWIVFRATNVREDVRFAAQHELDRREQAQREASAASTTGSDENDDDIPF